MGRLIDANALKESFRKQTVNVQGKIKDDADAIIEAICKDVDLAPTVYDVPVVRCKDCLWRHDDSSPMWLPCMERETPDDWFCADGERRSDGKQ